MNSTKTYIANALEAAGNKAKYDAEVKKILSDKYILSHIMRAVVSEFKDCTIEEVYAAIEGTPEVASVPLVPGKSNQQAITGMNTEDTIPGEGEVTFDIRFYAIVPSGEHIKIILNVEAQKSYYPGYDLVARAIFYCARMISAQLDVEFTVDNYGDIKKVYSIFICMEAPKYATNTITEYSISPKQIYGNFNGHAKYDLLSALMICLDKDDYSGGSSLHKLLSTVLSESITVDEKEKILEREYDIPMSRELKEGLNIMCNLSDLVEEKGIKKGIEQEREKTRTILRNMGLSEEEIEAKIKEAQEELSKASEQN